MKRLTLVSILVFAPAVSAAENETAVLPADSPAKATPAASPDATKLRSVSPETAAKLAAAAPKYQPPVVEPSEPAASPIMQETDRPKNQIIRLPQYIVGEQKAHVPNQLDVLTPKGKVEYAFDRHPGLRFGPLSWLNGPIALAMLDDDLQYERRKEERDLWSLYQIRDRPADNPASQGAK